MRLNLERRLKEMRFILSHVLKRLITILFTTLTRQDRAAELRWPSS